MGHALTRTILALAAGPLPGPADFESMIPPVRRAWVRRVAGHNLWVFYVFEDDHVMLLNLGSRPPVPVE